MYFEGFELLLSEKRFGKTDSTRVLVPINYSVVQVSGSYINLTIGIFSIYSNLKIYFIVIDIASGVKPEVALKA